MKLLLFVLAMSTSSIASPVSDAAGLDVRQSCAAFTGADLCPAGVTDCTWCSVFGNVVCTGPGRPGRCCTEGSWCAERKGYRPDTMICIGNLGGIVGSFIYQEKESPKYPTGFGTSLSFAAAGMSGEKTEDEWRAIYSEAQLEKMGDRSRLFKYHL
ncbi:hypothetical protein OPT61_g5390 [Boeremia exigua]|uniref:Uncharacterized protein n=1 Tax=Boeremia exigua TaxID=749465 RepID=A0ACC2IAK9_9PLEO|nr:hypothetical protein OPT61_g5390 [Boeremia exigua]